MVLPTDLANIILAFLPLPKLQLWEEQGIISSNIARFILIYKYGLNNNLVNTILNKNPNLTPMETVMKVGIGVGDSGYLMHLFIDPSIAIIYAIRSKNVDLVKYYLNRYNARYGFINEILQTAIQTDNLEIVRLIVAVAPDTIVADKFEIGPDLLVNKKWLKFVTIPILNNKIDEAFFTIDVEAIKDFTITNRNDVINSSFTVDVPMVTKDTIKRAKLAYNYLINVLKNDNSYLTCLKILLNMPITLKNTPEQLMNQYARLAYSVLNGQAIEVIKRKPQGANSSEILYDLNYYDKKLNYLSLYLTNQAYKIEGFNYDSIFDNTINDLRWNRDVIVGDPEMMLKLIPFNKQYEKLICNPNTIFDYKLMLDYSKEYRIPNIKFITGIDIKNDTINTEINKRYEEML